MVMPQLGPQVISLLGSLGRFFEVTSLEMQKNLAHKVTWKLVHLESDVISRIKLLVPITFEENNIGLHYLVTFKCLMYILKYFLF